MSSSVVDAKNPRWWLQRMLLPVLATAALAIVLERSGIDDSTHELFREGQSDVHPLHGSWFFGGFLYKGATYLLWGAGVALGLAALFGPRRARIPCAYVFSCLACSAALALVVPWGLHRLLGGVGGAPDVLATVGFAGISVYFVGAPPLLIARGFWIVPGLTFGALMALTQVVRGVQPVSHGPWSLALAWATAALLAALFQGLGWLRPIAPAREDADASFARPLEVDGILPWLLGLSAGLFGVVFYAVDLLLERFGDRFEQIEHWFEGLELALMALGLGVGAYFMAEHLRDIRARARRRIASEREQRLRILGRVAASVAHEVRNPLQTMRLIVDEQRLEIPKLAEHALTSAFEGCIERIDHAVDLVYRLARPESEEGERCDLVRVTREAAARLQGSRIDGATLQWASDPGPAYVQGASVSLGIVVDNLLRNAVHASPPGGAVELSAERRGELWQLRITNPGELAARTSDSPQGSSAGGQGLGLGLAISRQIAANAGGGIDLSEESGRVVCLLSWPVDAGPVA